jgi:hypothetical protein
MTSPFRFGEQTFLHLRYNKHDAETNMTQRSIPQKAADLDSVGGQIPSSIASVRGLTTMPLEWKISHPERLVVTVAQGRVGLQDIERYLDDVMVSDALPYRKIFDASQGTSALTDEDMMMLGARMSAYVGLGPLGPLAIVAPATNVRQQARLFAALAPADRPLKIFKTIKAARIWLDATPSATG